MPRVGYPKQEGVFHTELSVIYRYKFEGQCYSSSNSGNILSKSNLIIAGSYIILMTDSLTTLIPIPIKAYSSALLLRLTMFHYRDLFACQCVCTAVVNHTKTINSRLPLKHEKSTPYFSLRLNPQLSSLGDNNL